MTYLRATATFWVTLTAALTTIDAAGRPRSTVVWYFIDNDGQLKGTTYSDLEQYKDLRRDPNSASLIIDFSYPLRTLEVRATTELIADPDNGTARKVADRYGFAAARAPVRENCFTVIYRPRRLVTSLDWAKGNSVREGSRQVANSRATAFCRDGQALASARRRRASSNRLGSS